MQEQVASSRTITRTTRPLMFMLAASGMLTVCIAPSVQAVTLTNRDVKPHSIEVMVKSSRRRHELPAGKSLAKFCEEGCIIRLNDSADNDYQLEGTERVSIEGGLVYYDGEVIKPKQGSEGTGNSAGQPK